MSINDFTFNAKNKPELLHAQAFVTFCILSDLCKMQFTTNRMYRICAMAQRRAVRRFDLAYKGK
jgi:hypothetical protein